LGESRAVSRTRLVAQKFANCHALRHEATRLAELSVARRKIKPAAREPVTK